MSTAARVVDLLADVTEVGEVRVNLDLPLYDTQVLDSLKTVELIVAFEEAFGVEIPPAEFERDEWATPRKIIAYMERRVGT